MIKVLICSRGNYCDHTGFIVCNCERGPAELQRSLQLQMIYLCRKWPGQTAARSSLALLSISNRAQYGFKDMDILPSFVCKKLVCLCQSVINNKFQSMMEAAGSSCALLGRIKGALGVVKLNLWLAFTVKIK